MKKIYFTLTMNLTTSKIAGLVLIATSVVLVCVHQYDTAFGFASIGSGLIATKTVVSGLNKRSEQQNENI